MIVNTPEAWSEQAKLSDPYKAVRWSRKGQRERHEAVIRALRPRRGETLLDYGCGLGALAGLLPERVIYWGYDWAPGMIARARAEHPTLKFTDQEPGGRFDLVAIIGTFNLPHREIDGLAVLGELWQRTRRALAACFYDGDDPDCLCYSSRSLAVYADELAPRFTLTRHRDNDLLLLLER